MRDLLDRYLDHLTGVRAARTVSTYKAILIAFFAFLETRAFQGRAPSRSDLEAFLARPRRDGGRRAVTARNQALAALRVFTRWAVRDGGWATDPTDGVPFLREPDRDPAVLSAFELRRLFDLASREAGPLRSRNLAILALLSQLGLRVRELVDLDVSQVDVPSATLVAVRGKSASSHDLPLNDRTLALIAAWLVERDAIAPADERALLVSSSGRRLSPRDVQRLLAKLRARMGTAKRVTPHTLRHSAATLALSLGVDLATVGELLRHQSLNTTRKYLHLVDERRREAVRKLMIAIPPELTPEGAASRNAPSAPAGIVDLPREIGWSKETVDVDEHFGDPVVRDEGDGSADAPDARARAPRRSARRRRLPSRCTTIFGACSVGLTCAAPERAFARAVGSRLRHFPRGSP